MTGTDNVRQQLPGAGGFRETGLTPNGYRFFRVKAMKRFSS